MNKKIVIFTALILGFINGSGLKAQCDQESLMEKCASSLEDYVFITSFKIQTIKEGDKSSYSYVLSRGTNYKIVVCDQGKEGQRMIVNFLDRNKKLIATNYLKAGKKFFSTINYSCQVTGVYYVEAFFEGDKKGCGLNILGFKKG